MAALKGRRIALVEGRMQSELAALVQRHGGEPYSVSALREVSRSCEPLVQAFIEALNRGDIQVVICQTGVGVTALMQEAERLNRSAELIAGLGNVTLVCRGPKPVAVLKRYALAAAVQAQTPYTTADLLQAMEPLALAGCGVGLLHYGERNDPLAHALQGRGAQLHELCLYEWALPDDIGPLQMLVRELIAGQLDAIAFTSKVQVRHLWQVATELGDDTKLTEVLNQRLIVAAVGPSCAAELQAYGVIPDVVPNNPRMGPMVMALIEFYNRDAEMGEV